MRVFCPGEFPEEYTKLLVDCWAQKPQGRPSFSQALARLVNMSAGLR